MIRTGPVDTGFLTRARAAADSLRVDTCIITRPGARGALDETTLQYPTAAVATVYDGPCEFVMADGSGMTMDAAEQRLEVQQVTVKLPVDDSMGVRLGDLVTAGSGTNDPALTGRQFRVTRFHHKTYAASRRLVCDEITGEG